MGDKNNVVQTEGSADLLVKSGHGILKAIYTSQTGDRNWIIRDGVCTSAATGSITVTCALRNVFATGTILVNFCCIAACDTVTVNGLVYTAVCGAKDCTDTQFSICTCANAVATDLADSIDDDCRTGTLGGAGGMTSVSCTATVTSTTDVSGIVGNTITQATSNAVAFTPETPFTGGVDVDTVTVNGVVFSATCANCACCGEWDTSCCSCMSATNLALMITCDTRTPITVPTHPVTGAACMTVVTLTAAEGTAGNCIDLATSDACTLALSGAFLTGGLGREVIEIDLVAATSGELSFPYFNHPMRDGIFIDYIAGCSGRLTIIYE